MDGTHSKMVLILDASVIIAFFDELSRPDLMKKLAKYYQLMMPSPAFDELNYDERHFAEDAGIRVIPVYRDQVESVIDPHILRIHDGERSCIYLALQIEGSTVVFDDRNARKCAEAHNIPLTGTIGLLSFLIEKGEISKEEALELCYRLERSGFRIDAKVLDILRSQ